MESYLFWMMDLYPMLSPIARVMQDLKVSFDPVERSVRGVLW